MNNSHNRTRMLVMLSLFTAVSYLSVYIIGFKVSFLTFDVKNVFITVAAMLYGPVPGVVVSLLAALLELLLYSTTGFYGFIMNFLSSASFALVAGWFYRRHKTMVGSYLALTLATVMSTSLMMVANLFITPFYMGGSMTDVAKMIPTLLFPFNLIKCVVNAALVLVLYKPISLVLTRAGMIKKEGGIARYLTGKTAITLLIAAVLIAASMTVFFLVLGGKIDFGT